MQVANQIGMSCEEKEETTYREYWYDQQKV